MAVITALTVVTALAVIIALAATIALAAPTVPTAITAQIAPTVPTAITAQIAQTATTVLIALIRPMHQAKIVRDHGLWSADRTTYDAGSYEYMATIAETRVANSQANVIAELNVVSKSGRSADCFGSI